jgi:hypothetical protein
MLKPIYTCGAEPNRAVYMGKDRVLPPYVQSNPRLLGDLDTEKIYVGWGDEDQKNGEPTAVRRMLRTSPPEGWSIGPFPDHLSAQQWIDSRTYMNKGELTWGTMRFPSKSHSRKALAR